MPATDSPAGFRVTYGWSAFADFASEPAALTFATKMAARPTHDPAMRLVSILRLGPAPYPVIWKAERDLEPRP